MGSLFARIWLGDPSGVAFPVPIVATSSTSQSYDHDEFLLTSIICSVTMLGNHASILSTRYCGIHEKLLPLFLLSGASFI
jgi:hypothetical protein